MEVGMRWVGSSQDNLQWERKTLGGSRSMRGVARLARLARLVHPRGWGGSDVFDRCNWVV